MIKSIYFFITYSSKQKENEENDSDIEFVVPEKRNLKPIFIFKKENYENQRYYYNKIYSIDKPKKKERL